MYKKSLKYNDLSPSTKLWRYMPYSKFIDILKTSSLYFCRVDLFDDKLEATQPEGSHVFATSTQNPWQMFEFHCLNEQLKIMRGLTFASCWHIAENESPNMWANYAMTQNNFGIAIQTTLADLTRSITSSRIVTGIRMKYIDYSSCYMNYFMANPFDFLQIKDKSFEYENELCLVTVEDSYPRYDADDPEFWHKTHLYECHGEKISIDLVQMIKRIFLSPNATDQFRFEVARQLAFYNLNVPIAQGNSLL